MKKKLTKAELENNTLKGKGKKKGLLGIASDLKIDTNGLNKTPLVEEILKVQDGKTEAKTLVESQAEEFAEVVNPDKTDTATGEPVKGEAPLPVELDEEAQAAAKFTKSDAKAYKYVEDGLLPDTINARAAKEQVAPVEIVRRKAAEYAEVVKDNQKELNAE